jgi:hypothetical protein
MSQASAVASEPKHILVEFKSEVLGAGVFWQGPASDIEQIHNIPARETARLVVRDGKPRVCGMWHVSTTGAQEP